MISEFAQPSNPSNKIYLREATVKQALGFSDSRESHSEKATTQFLNEVQIPEHFTDSREWTEGDRITALLWYHIHVTDDPSVSLPYECSFCGTSHSNYFDIRQLTNGYGHLQGAGYRDTSVNDRPIVIKPIKGGQSEEIQASLLGLEGEPLKNASALERAIHSISFKGRDSNYEDRREWVLNLSVSDYRKLLSEINQAHLSMKHGVPHEWVEGDLCLPAPVHHCINKHKLTDDQKEGAMTSLLWPFLSSDFIPVLHP